MPLQLKYRLVNNYKESVHSVTIFSVELSFSDVSRSTEILAFPAMSFDYVSILFNFLLTCRM